MPDRSVVFPWCDGGCSIDIKVCANTAHNTIPFLGMSVSETGTWQADFRIIHSYALCKTNNECSSYLSCHVWSFRYDSCQQHYRLTTSNNLENISRTCFFSSEFRAWRSDRFLNRIGVILLCVKDRILLVNAETSPVCVGTHKNSTRVEKWKFKLSRLREHPTKKRAVTEVSEWSVTWLPSGYVVRQNLHGQQQLLHALNVSYWFCLTRCYRFITLVQSDQTVRNSRHLLPPRTLSIDVSSCYLSRCAHICLSCCYRPAFSSVESRPP